MFLIAAISLNIAFLVMSILVVPDDMPRQDFVTDMNDSYIFYSTGYISFLSVCWRTNHDYSIFGATQVMSLALDLSLDHIRNL